ncbi:GntR family transcriptional regulator [Alkalibacillus haloalkaliphilus]|uniref:GntR family transcriptional regulator n=1 Tax=Alkalibacillus haloalkaliphilus TaxID=94136 RepID=UPI00031C3B18|nr:GntR family transcriptional regulator [Alkalibacillus haloalkaliphilus]
MKFVKQSDGKPLYQQIAKWMTEHINLGKWKEGYKLPAEEELAYQLNVSRGTVRKAIAKLLKQGLLEQIQGKGTFVRKQKISYPFAQELISFAEAMEIKGYYFDTDVVSYKVMQPSEWVQNKLEVGLYDLVYYVKRVRKIDYEPAIIIENWVSIDRCPGVDQANINEKGLFKVIEECADVELTYGVRSFAAKALNEEEARLLNLKEGAPVLYLDQQTFGPNDLPLECSRIVLRTDQYEVASVLKR